MIYLCSMASEREMVKRVNIKLDSLLECLNEEIEKSLAMLYRKHIFGREHPLEERKWRGDGKSFWEEFQKISPVKFDKEELQFVLYTEEKWPGESVTHAIAYLGHRRFDMTHYRRGLNPLADILADIHLVSKYGIMPSKK